MDNFKSALTISHTVLATTFHFFVFESNEPLTFQPGQYIKVKVGEEKLNAYSIAGYQEPTRFSLLVDIIPGGLGAKFFESLKVGEMISYLGPAGTFILKTDDGAKQLLFLATGCGISPLKPQIEAALKEHHLKMPITLYFSFRTSQDVIFEEYFKELTERFPNFNIKITVDPVFLTDLLQKDFSDMGDFAAYLSGSKVMVEEATKILLEKGCPKSRIYTENY